MSIATLEQRDKITAIGIIGTGGYISRILAAVVAVIGNKPKLISEFLSAAQISVGGDVGDFDAEIRLAECADYLIGNRGCRVILCEQTGRAPSGFDLLASTMKIASSENVTVIGVSIDNAVSLVDDDSEQRVSLVDVGDGDPVLAAVRLALEEAGYLLRAAAA